jgi:hypothetical protein
MPVKYLLPCTCGQATPLEASQAGQRVTCACGATLTAPTMRGLAALEKVTEPEPKAKSQRRWSRGQGMLFSGGVVTALVALAATGYMAMIYSEAESNKSQMREFFANQSSDERIDSMAPSDLLKEWYEHQARGLEEAESASWRRFSEVSRHMVMAMGVALAVALAGILTAASALFFRPK